MTRIEKFRKNLACVFDDNLHTKVWHNIVDWTIIALILVSSLEIFLSTFEGISERFGGGLEVYRYIYDCHIHDRSFFAYMGCRLAEPEIFWIQGENAILSQFLWAD